MAKILSLFFMIISLLAFAPILCLSSKTNYNYSYLYPQFYDGSCPKAKEIVKSVVAKAVAKEARMAASLLRLHFHDCFVKIISHFPIFDCPKVCFKNNFNKRGGNDFPHFWGKGCDASVLLDSSETLISEKLSNTNMNSARGFEVIDEIKSALEKECPQTVSCADILTLAARDSIVLAGGPSWEVPLGRRDARDASISGSNNCNNIPAQNNTFSAILTKFKIKGLDLVDFVTLSGSHTIGKARCTSFKQRLYNQSGKNLPDYTLDKKYAAQLSTKCPKFGGDQNLFFLDYVSPTKFDNNYYKNLLASKGLLNSDQILVTKNETSLELVKLYAKNNKIFFEQFTKSMVKLGNISPLVGHKGEIRKNCRKMN